VVGLSGITAARWKLKVGQELSGEEVSNLVRAGRKDKLLEVALSFLEYRPRSEKEIADYLKKRTFKRDYGFSSPEEKEVVLREVIDRLRELRLVDDRAFGRWWIDQRQKARKPKGRWFIRSELKRKGLALEVIDELLDSLKEGREEEAAWQLAQKKYSLLLGRGQKNAFTLRQKIKRYLVGRGFGYEVVQKVVERLANEE